MKNPTYWCVIGLAWYEAYSTDSTEIRSDQLREIAVAQAEVSDTSGAQRTLRAASAEAARDSSITGVKGLARIAIAQTDIGDMEAARQTFSTLSFAVEEIAADQSHPSRNLAPGYLAAAYAQSGQIRKAVSKYVKSHLIRKLKSPLNPSTEVACMFSLRTGGHPCSSERTI